MHRSRPRAPCAPRWRRGRPRRAPRAGAGRRRAAGSAARPCGRGRRSAPPRARRCRRRAAIAALALLPEPVDPLVMRAPPYRDLVEGDRRRHRGVERLRADRDVGGLVARGDDRGREPLALGADHQRHARPARARQRPAGARRQRDRAPGQLGDGCSRARPARGRSRPSTRAPPSGRRGRPCRGRARRWRRRTRAPRAAPCRRCRVVDAPQRHADRARRRAAPSAAGRSPSARVPEPSWETLREQVRRDLLARQPGALLDEQRSRRPAGRGGGLDQVLALGDELARLVAPLAARELADLLERSLCGLVMGIAWNEKGRPSWIGGAPGAAGVVGR